MKTNKFLLILSLIAFLLAGCNKPDADNSLAPGQGKDTKSVEKSFSDANIQNMTIDDLKKGSKHEKP
jgi:predicted small secreted protein